VDGGQQGAFLVAGGTGAALLVGKAHEQLVVTVAAADVGEALMQIAALEKGGYARLRCVRRRGARILCKHMRNIEYLYLTTKRQLLDSWLVSVGGGPLLSQELTMQATLRFVNFCPEPDGPHRLIPCVFHRKSGRLPRRSPAYESKGKEGGNG
jgi:hypothetical protein